MGCMENLMSLLPGLRNQRKKGGGILHEHEPSILVCQTLQSRAEQKGASLWVL